MVCFSAFFQLYIASFIQFYTTPDVTIFCVVINLYAIHKSKFTQRKENTLASNDVMYVYYFSSDVHKNRTKPKPRSGVKTEPKPTEIF